MTSRLRLKIVVCSKKILKKYLSILSVITKDSQ
nr:MAG TPA: hypothetical protein [Caudoviricetes sp.]